MTNPITTLNVIGSGTTRSMQTVVATSQGQLTFSTTGYSPGLINVFLSGVCLVPNVDYSAVDGITIVLNSQFASAIAAGSILVVEALTSYAVANAVLGTSLASASGSNIVGFQQSGTGAIARTVQAKLQDTVSILDFGADPLGIQDSTSAINAAVASGLALWWPTGTYNISSTITCTAQQTWQATGPVLLKNTAPFGSPAAPILNFVAKVTMLGPFTVDGNANNGNYGAPTLYAGNIISGSTILVQGDSSRISGVTVQNAWDNGISVVNISPTTNVAVAGSPHYVILSDIETVNCGCGNHPNNGGKVGAGIDVASGSACNVSNCTDFNSYVGFIVDIGAGASANFSNCFSWYPQQDTVYPNNGSGYGFYVGSADCQFVNCGVYGSAYRGWWIDGYAYNCSFTNCVVETCYDMGFFVKSTQIAFVNCRVKNASQRGAGVTSAWMFDSTVQVLSNISLVGCYTDGAQQAFAIDFNTPTNAAYLSVMGCNFNGTNGTISSKTNAFVNSINGSQNSNRIGVNRNSPGFEFDVFGRVRASASVANSSYKTAVFGDSSNNGTVFIEDFATPAKRIAIGYDPTNDVAVIQSIQAGVAKKPMMINPSGGPVTAGAGNLAANATDGFFSIPQIANTPTGVPGTQTGYSPIAFDATNNKIWIYTGSSWKSVTVS